MLCWALHRVFPGLPYLPDSLCSCRSKTSSLVNRIVIAARIIPIADPADPRLADYAGLKDAALRADEAAGRRGVFNAEGETILRIIAASRFRVRSVLLTPTRLDGLRDVLDSLPDGTPAYVLPESAMHALVGFPFHRGVLACGERPAPIDLTTLLASSRTLVILESLTNAENVGAVFRNTAALAGAGSAVLLSPSCCDPLYRKAVRVSMGHVLRVPYAKLTAWPHDITAIKQAGFKVLAMTPGPGSIDINDLRPTPNDRLAILLGTEGEGLSKAALAAADTLGRIPMAPGVDSLNVGVACAVALHHLGRAED
ncbi:MAG: rRNA methyltransferase [Phycisphaerae bacterium]|nr:MAG: rRNA methyltransferase [Phycisphaerae bacterium]